MLLIGLAFLFIYLFDLNLLVNLSEEEVGWCSY